MSKKIISTTWFTEMGSVRPIGIVVTQDEITKERKAFIGTCNGHSEDKDTRSIISYGAKIHPVILESLMLSLKGSSNA